METKRLHQLIDRFPEALIPVVGDLMLDRFIWGNVRRISPEAPVPVVQVTKESTHLGGSANVVSNLFALGGRALPVGLVGEDEAAETLRRLMAEDGVSQEGLIVDPRFQTIQKTRIIAHHQQVVRVDRELEGPLREESLTQIEDRLFELAAGASAVIVSDYGKGVVTKSLLKGIDKKIKKIPVSVDPKDLNFNYYKRVHILTPNQAEAERMAQLPIRETADLNRAAAAIFKRLQCENLLITRGERGMALFDGPEHVVHIPTRAREVFDVSGAGDTVIATYTLAKAVGASPLEASVLANAAAGVVVAKLGTATASAQELKEALAQFPPTAL